jgi:hypothetical protein
VGEDVELAEPVIGNDVLAGKMVISSSKTLLTMTMDEYECVSLRQDKCSVDS